MPREDHEVAVGRDGQPVGGYSQRKQVPADGDGFIEPSGTGDHHSELLHCRGRRPAFPWLPLSLQQRSHIK